MEQQEAEGENAEELRSPQVIEMPFLSGQELY